MSTSLLGATLNLYHKQHTMILVRCSGSLCLKGQIMSANDTGTRKSSLRREVSLWWGWLFGTAVSTVGVISFIQTVFGIHLVPAYAHGLSVYREVVHTLFSLLYTPLILLVEWVASWFHLSLRISIPGWFMDLAALSTVNMAAWIRGKCLAEGIPWSEANKVRIIWDIMVYGLTLFGSFMVLAFLLDVSFSRESYQRIGEQERRLFKAYRLSLVAIVVGAFFFFVTNAYVL
jgi:hypothetical protein